MSGNRPFPDTNTHTHTHTLTQHTGVLAATYVGPTKPGDGKLDDRITHLHLVSLLQITRAQYHYLNSFKVVLKLHPSCLHCIENYHCLSIILTVFWIKEERDKPWLCSDNVVQSVKVIAYNHTHALITLAEDFSISFLTFAFISLFNREIQILKVKCC